MDTHPVLAYYIDSTLNLTHPLVVNGTAKYARIHMKNYKKSLQITNYQLRLRLRTRPSKYHQTCTPSAENKKRAKSK